jgi:Flp pilus assembly protein TadD
MRLNARINRRLPWRVEGKCRLPCFFTGIFRCPTPHNNVFAVTPVDEETVQLHNTLMRGAADILLPYLSVAERKEKDATAPEDRAAVQRGIEMLERVLQINPQNWSASWFLGMAFNVLVRLDDAYQAFARAYSLHQDNPDVGRQLVLACLSLGKATEALNVSSQLLARWPDDSGFLANHALACLINNRVSDAVAAITRSLELNPDDPISRNVQKVILECQTGRRSPPSQFHQ